MKKAEEDLSIVMSLSLSKQPTLQPFSSVTKIDLFGANLSSLPSCMPQCLPNLSILFCIKNHFQTMPAVIGECQNLQMVSFKSNKITSLHPDSLQPQLRWLILTDNKLKKLPDTIGRCVKLQKCMLSGNQLEELPCDIANCCNLELIRLASNSLKDPPMTLLKLPKLSWVALSDNPFLKNDHKNNEFEKDIELPLIDDEHLDNPELGEILGKGASGITRQFKLNGDYVAVKEYYSAITSDGNPQEERKVSMTCSSLGCKSLVRVLGQTKNGNLVMDLLTDYHVLGNSPTWESCSRDVYDSGLSVSKKRAISMVGNLLDALTKLHDCGICHGDFYAHNLLISTVDEEQVWLTDFGAAFFYNKTADYGKLIEMVERRSFGIFVNEVAELICDTDQVLKKRLREFADSCDMYTFVELCDNWKACDFL